MITIQGGEFIIREWKFEDEFSLQQYADNENVSRYLADRFPYPYTYVDAQNWLQFIVGSSPVSNFAIEVNGEAVGGIGFDLLQGERRKTAHLGYWLGEPFWGKRIMSEVTRLVIDYAFDNFDIERIDTLVYHPNVASMRVLEKVGFVKEGVQLKAIFKNGSFFDAHMFALLRGGETSAIDK